MQEYCVQWVVPYKHANLETSFDWKQLSIKSKEVVKNESAKGKPSLLHVGQYKTNQPIGCAIIFHSAYKSSGILTYGNNQRCIMFLQMI